MPGAYDVRGERPAAARWTMPGAEADAGIAYPAPLISAGQTRAEYLRRLLAEQQGPALTREQLTRFTERTADLADPEVMAAAWR